jgi:hypothetical protein
MARKLQKHVRRTAADPAAPPLTHRCLQIAPGLGIVIPVLSLNAGLQTGDYGTHTPQHNKTINASLSLE